MLGVCLLPSLTSRLYNPSLKPVLNWGNVCSLNILRTVRRTMIGFLIELLLRRTLFGQSQTLLRSQLARSPNLRQTRSRQHDRKCRLKSSQYTFIILHRVLQLLYHSGSPRQGCASHKPTNKQIPSEASEEPSDTVIHFFSSFFFFIHRRALLSASQRQCSSNRANVPRTC